MAKSRDMYKIRHRDKDGKTLWMSYYKRNINNDGVEGHAFLFTEDRMSAKTFRKSYGIAAAEALYDSIIDHEQTPKGEFEIDVVGPGFIKKIGDEWCFMIQWMSTFMI